MARKQIGTVYLERQPHRNGLKRLQLAYQLLIADANQVIAEEKHGQNPKPHSQEVEKCQS